MTRSQALSVCIIFSSAIVGSGCASSSEEIKSSNNDQAVEFIHVYEKTFNPSDYDSETTPEKSAAKNQEFRTDQENSTPASAESEVVSGFRIQVTFSENIEVANQVKNELSALLPDEQVYVVYEAPYYKVRVGDFLSRPEANLNLRTLTERGYKDAWIVPDKVRKETGR